MDALGRLLSLYPPRGRVDVRCHLGAPWSLAHDAARAGVVPYHLMLSGSAWLDMPGRPALRLQAGDIVVLPHGAAHRLHAGDDRSTTSTPMAEVRHGMLLRKENGQDGPASDILCGQFEFGAQAGKGLLSALPELLLVRTAADDNFASLQALTAMLRVETANMRAGAELIVSELSSVLFSLLMRAWLQQPGLQQGWFGLLAERRLQPALTGMLGAPEQGWTLQRMAAACHMSRATFVRLFQQAAGASPVATLLQIRMARATQYLAQDARSVGAIGEAVGYQSEAAFSRAFKKAVGMGPGQYRRLALAPPA